MNKAPNLPRRMTWLRCIVCVMLAAGMTWKDVAAESASNSIVARQVMAAYLYKFGGYVEWPKEAFADTNSPITIGVIDAAALADELEQMVRDRTVQGRQILIRRLKPGDPCKGLNVLFIGGTGSDRLAEILAGARSQPILTVTEAENGLGQGSIINFVVVDGKLRFEVSPKAAGQSSLNISARLLVAAYKVDSEL